MRSSTSPDQEVDAVGLGGREQVLRRVVASTVAFWVFWAVFSLSAVSSSSMGAVALAYLVLLPLTSSLLEWRWPNPTGRADVVRGSLLGALLGCVTLVLLIQALPSSFTFVAITTGAVAGGVGVWIAAALPGRGVTPAAAISMVSIAAAGVVALT